MSLNNGLARELTNALNMFTIIGTIIWMWRLKQNPRRDDNL